MDGNDGSSIWDGVAICDLDGHWHIDLLHIKSGSELIICLNIVLTHSDEIT